MDVNDLRSVVTVLSFVAFVGIVAWAWSGRRRAAFDAAARLALHDDEPAIGSAGDAPSTGAIK
jgi:cytochrome c oxidase cbb3-type subunit 4